MLTHIPRSIIEGIASTKNLSALNFDNAISIGRDSFIGVKDRSKYRLKPGPMGHMLCPLARIKNLKHLRVSDRLMFHRRGEHHTGVFQEIICNSASTLESLVIETSWIRQGDRLLSDWLANNDDDTSSPALSSLKSLGLSCLSLHYKFIESLPQTINLLNLTELSLGPLDDQYGHLFHTLADALTQSTPRLRILSLDLTNPHDIYGRNRTRPSLAGDSYSLTSRLEAQARFLGSFDTLTKLHLYGCGGFNPLDSEDCGFSDLLFDSILLHTEMEILELMSRDSVLDALDSSRYPALDAQMVGMVVGAMPTLRELAFAPKMEEQEQHAVAAALSRAPRLESVMYNSDPDADYDNRHDPRGGRKKCSSQCPCAGMFSTLLRGFRDAVSSQALPTKGGESRTRDEVLYPPLKTFSTRLSRWEIPPLAFAAHRHHHQVSDDDMVASYGSRKYHPLIRGQSGAGMKVAPSAWLEGVDRANERGGGGWFPVGRLAECCELDYQVAREGARVGNAYGMDGVVTSCFAVPGMGCTGRAPLRGSRGWTGGMEEAE